MEWQLHSISTFEKFQKYWDELNLNNGDTPLLDSRFVLALLEYFGTGKESLAVCSINSTPCSLAIVTKSGFGVWQTFQPSQAPIGCWVQDQSIATEALAEGLGKALPGITFVLGITQQDPNLLARTQDSSCCESLDYITTASVAVEGSFDDYWSMRGKNLRQNLRRQRNRLAREEVDVHFSILIEPASMHDAVKDYGDLESAGWKSESDTAVHIDNSQGKFYAKILQKFAETEQAFVFQYRYNDILVATDFCIDGGGYFIILKTTYDENIKTTSPAILMREDEFKYIFSNQLATRIEFYGKVMEWHTKWSDDFRTMYHVNHYSKLGKNVRAIRNRGRK